MGLLKTLLVGRPDGIRAKLRGLQRSDKPASPGTWPAETPEERQSSGVNVGGKNPMEPPRDVTPPEGFEVAMHVDALSDGELTEVIMGGTAIAICRLGDEYHAMSNVCPHAGGPIGDGSLEGDKVTCPYHGWRFDVKTGASSVNPDVKLPIFDVAIEGNAVCVKF